MDAVVGRRVDLAHPACVSWLQARAVDPGAAGAPPAATKAEPAAPDPDPTNCGELAALSRLRAEALRDFGSATEYADWLAIRKLRAETALVERKNATHAGRLISTEHVRMYVLGALQSLSGRLLGDLAITIPQRLRPLLAGTPDIEAAREVYRGLITTALRSTRVQIVKSIRAAVDNPQDRPPAVGESSPRTDHSPPVDMVLLRAINQALSDVAPQVLESPLRIVARHCAGQPFSDHVFDRAMTLQPAIETECLARVRGHLGTAVDTAVRRHARDLTGDPAAAPETST